MKKSHKTPCRGILSSIQQRLLFIFAFHLIRNGSSRLYRTALSSPPFSLLRCVVFSKCNFFFIIIHLFKWMGKLTGSFELILCSVATQEEGSSPLFSAQQFKVCGLIQRDFVSKREKQKKTLFSTLNLWYLLYKRQSRISFGTKNMKIKLK